MTFRGDNLVNDAVAEGSKTRKVADYSSEDPFTSTRNAMPTPPSKDKKPYLEDFMNFSVE